MVREMIEIIKKMNYKHYGLRQLPDDQNLLVGNILQDSNHWDDGIPSDESCGGACAMLVCSDLDEDEVEEQHIISAAKELGRNACRILNIEFSGHHSYEGQRLVLCGSDSVEYGNDPGEVIMHSAVALIIVN